MSHLPLSVQISSYSRSWDCKVLVKFYFSYKQTIQDPFPSNFLSLALKFSQQKTLWHNQHPLQSTKFLKGSCCKEPWIDQKEIIGAGEIWTRLFSHIIETGQNSLFSFFDFLRSLVYIKQDALCTLSLQHLPSPYSTPARPIYFRRAGHSFSLVSCLFSSTFPFPSENFHASTSSARRI